MEADAVEHGGDRLVLQTGDKQPEAIALYEELGYRPIPAYPPYVGALPKGRYFARMLGWRGPPLLIAQCAPRFLQRTAPGAGA